MERREARQAGDHTSMVAMAPETALTPPTAARRLFVACSRNVAHARRSASRLLDRSVMAVDSVRAILYCVRRMCECVLDVPSNHLHPQRWL